MITIKYNDAPVSKNGSGLNPIRSSVTLSQSNISTSTSIIPIKIEFTENQYSNLNITFNNSSSISSFAKSSTGLI
jgi:hypothetical protein